MNTLVSRLWCAGALLCGGAAWLAAGGSGAQPGDGVRYVDLARCFEKYGAAQQGIAGLRDQLSTKMEEFKVREAALEEQRDGMAVLDPASTSFAEQVHELETRKLALDRDKQFALDLLQRRQLELFLSSYQAVQRAAAQLGAREGFGAVLVLPEPPSDKPSDLATSVEILQSRAVLWINPSYDVTDAVLELLNAG